MKNKIVGALLIILSLSIVTVSAFVYEQATQTVTQSIVEVANITLSDADLGEIDEGDTIYYTPGNMSALDDIIDIITTKFPVYLHLDSDLESQTSYYNTYEIVVKFDTVPGGSGHATGDTACTLNMTNPDTASGINLDVDGSWTFDFYVTTNPKSVSSNQTTTVNITVSAENAS